MLKQSHAPNLPTDRLTPGLSALAVAVIGLLLSGCGISSSALDTQASLAPAPAEVDASAPKGAHGTSQIVTLVDTTDVSHSVAAFTAAATPGSHEYKIGPDDILDISVFKVAELTRTAQVTEDGTVNLPLVGDLHVAGKTAQDIERELAKKLGAKYLRSPQVTVLVKEYNSQRITMDGAVKKPGIYPIRGKTTLLQMIANAGGLDEASDSSNVIVFRQSQAKRLAAKFDYDSIRAGSAEDPPLQQGDVVVVNSSKIKEAFANILKALPITSLFRPIL